MHLPRGDLRRVDGGSGGGIRGHREYRWIEDLALKGVSAFALVDDDQQRHTERRKMTRRNMSHGVLGLPWWVFARGFSSQGHGPGVEGEPGCAPVDEMELRGSRPSGAAKHLRS